MKDINHAFFTGNLTREPELRHTASGAAVLSFGVAIGDSRRNAQGGWDEYTHFVDVTVFGNMAETLSKMLRKGMRVTVSGKLSYRAWEKDGQRRSKLEIIANDVILPPRQNPAPNQATAPQTGVYAPRNQQPQTYQAQGYEFTEVYADDDLPF